MWRTTRYHSKLTEKGSTVKIKADFDLCESNALCEALAPEVFELDDDDFLQLKTDETTPDNIEQVRRAVASCPRAALSLEEE